MLETSGGEQVRLHDFEGKIYFSYDAQSGLENVESRIGQSILDLDDYRSSHIYVDLENTPYRERFFGVNGNNSCIKIPVSYRQIASVALTMSPANTSYSGGVNNRTTIQFNTGDNNLFFFEKLDLELGDNIFSFNKDEIGTQPRMVLPNIVDHINKGLLIRSSDYITLNYELDADYSMTAEQLRNKTYTVIYDRAGFREKAVAFDWDKLEGNPRLSLSFSYIHGDGGLRILTEPRFDEKHADICSHVQQRELTVGFRIWRDYHYFPKASEEQLLFPQFDCASKELDLSYSW